MKKIVLLSFLTIVLGLNLIQAQSNPVLFSVNDENVYLNEFEAVFKKNNFKDTIPTREALEEHLNLYVNFKLKVKEAEFLKYDTISKLQNELLGYRKQLAEPYLIDKNVTEKLLKESYDRLQKDVKVAHVLIRVESNALPADTLIAYNKIIAIRNEILAGGDFATIAKAKSEDKSAQYNSGELPYFSAFQMVYPFETLAYNTPVGQLSMPIRTRFGYHIIKGMGQRPAMGVRTVAHIMIGLPKEPTETEIADAKKRIDAIYQRVKAGEDFAKLAQELSEDEGSKTKGGELKSFDIKANLSPIFKDLAATIKNVGDISEPVKTTHGWHIIKLLNVQNIGAYKEIEGDLKMKVKRDERSNLSVQSFLNSLKNEYKFKDSPKAKTAFYPIVDSSMYKGEWSKGKAAGLTSKMFVINKKIYTQTQFAAYLEENQRKFPQDNLKSIVDNLYNRFVEESLMAYEDSRLEEKYPEFKTLVKEYRDGILLFELTDNMVWSKALKDTTGLKAFYELNKNNYMTTEGVDATVYECNDELTAKKTLEMLTTKKTDVEINDAINTPDKKLNIYSKVYYKGDNDLVDGMNKQIKTSAIISQKGKFYVIQTHKITPPEPKKLNNAKGLVIADYQNKLEADWIKELQQKYKVVVYKDKLDLLLKK